MAGLVCGLIKTRTRMGWGYDMTQSHNKLTVISTITKNYLETSVGAFYLLKPRAWCGVASHDWREGEERRGEWWSEFGGESLGEGRVGAVQQVQRFWSRLVGQASILNTENTTQGRSQLSSHHSPPLSQAGRRRRRRRRISGRWLILPR